jgi:pyruvate dehydrogenase kinase 2/3/4
MRRMLISRISRRVLAEHHIALSEIHAGKRRQPESDPHVGIIFTGLQVKRSIEKCVKVLRQNIEEPTSAPSVIIDGQEDTQFAYIREHLE